MSQYDTEVPVELDGTEFLIDFEWSYYYDPGKTTGPWEDCYPESEEFEVYHNEDHMKYSAMEWWELEEFTENLTADYLAKEAGFI